MERKYNRKVIIAKKPIHSYNRGPNHNSEDDFYETFEEHGKEMKEEDRTKESCKAAGGN